MTLNPLLEPAAKDICKQLMDQIKGAKAVVIASEDGFELASQLKNDIQIARLSAMSSSLSALGVLAGDESGLGNCNSVIMEADKGYLAIVQVRRPDVSLIISVITSSDSVIGQVAYFSKQAALTLEKISTAVQT